MVTDLIFDFFGTLVQYVAGPFHTEPYSRTHDYLLQQGFELPYEDFTFAFEVASQKLEESANDTGQEYHMDELGRLFFQTAFAVDPPDAVLSSFVSLFLEEWSRGIVYLDSIRPFLERLAQNYRLSVLSNTNYPPLIHKHLSAMGVAEHFVQVFTSVEVGVRKPYPAIFQHALEQLCVNTDAVVYIGDSYIADYQGASSAGIRSILIDPKGKYPHVPTRIEFLFALEQHL